MNEKIVNVQKIKCEESNSDVLVIVYEDRLLVVSYFMLNDTSHIYL